MIRLMREADASVLVVEKDGNDSQAVVLLAVPKSHRPGVRAISRIGRFQIFVPDHASVIKHSPGPGGHAAEIPFRERRILQRGCRRILPRDAPHNAVRLDLEFPGLMDFFPRLAKDDLGHGESILVDDNFWRGDAGLRGKPLPIQANSAGNARFCRHLAPAHNDLIQNATTFVIQPQRQLLLPVSQRYQLPCGILLNRPRSARERGSPADQPCSQQQQINPAIRKNSSRGFSFTRTSHPPPAT